MKTRFVADIKWGRCDENPVLSDLPKDFLRARELIEKKDEQGLRLLENYLKCSFNPSNINADLSEIFIRPHQLEAEGVEIFGADLVGEVIPTVRATGVFEIETVPRLTAEAVDDWESRNEWLDNGVTFYWDLKNGAKGDLYFLWEHEGSSFRIDQPS